MTNFLKDMKGSIHTIPKSNTYDVKRHKCPGCGQEFTCEKFECHLIDLLSGEKI